jgi:hypothetical protein
MAAPGSNYSKKEKDDAKKFLAEIGIGPRHTLYKHAVEWYVSKIRKSGSALSKKESEEFILALTTGGINKVKSTKVYKKIIDEIENIALNHLINPSGKPAPNTPPSPPRSQSSRSRRTQGTPGAMPTPRGNAGASGGTNQPPSTGGMNPQQGNKFITDKLTDTLVYGDPKYNNTTLYFQNDFDKVAYILRNKRTKSAQHDRYFDWARRVSGQKDDVIRKHGEKVLKQIKKTVGTGTPAPDQIIVNSVPLDFNPPTKQSKTPISGASLLGRSQSASSGPISGQSLINQSANIGHGQSYQDILDSLIKIQESVDKILDLIKNEQKAIAKYIDQNRKLDERKRRESRERLSENKVSGIVKDVLKLFAPVQGILDRILNFIVYTLLGRTMVALIDWMADPKNRDKIKSIARFLKDWWPVLLGAYILFFTRIGSLIRTSIGLSIKLTRLMATKIPELIKFLRALGPRGRTVAAIATVGTIGAGLYLKNRGDEEEKKKNQNQIPPTKSYSSGGGIGKFKPRKLNIGDIGFSGGRVTDASGVEVTGARPDTQLIVAQPGEYVVSKKGVENAERMYGPGFLENLNRMAGASGIPQIVNNIQLANQGGFVGGSPKMKPEDYYSLLAISAAEDSSPQGRADVAQSIYNRLFASGSKYNMNFMQNEGRNTIKDIIVGEKQYEPTFPNRGDWMKIRDKNSAVKALAGYLAKRAERPGSVIKSDLKDALKMINDTEKALKNSKLQREAQKFVQGRLSFYGTSEREHVKGDDVYRKIMVGGKQRDARGNSFSHHLADESKNRYATERRKVAAPIPSMMIAPKPKPKSIGGQFVERIFSVFNQLIKPSNIKPAPSVQAPPPRRRGNADVSFLPPVKMPNQNNYPRYHSPVSIDIPDFNLYPPSMISDRRVVREKLGIAA